MQNMFAKGSAGMQQGLKRDKGSGCKRTLFKIVSVKREHTLKCLFGTFCLLLCVYYGAEQK